MIWLVTKARHDREISRLLGLIQRMLNILEQDRRRIAQLEQQCRAVSSVEKK